MKIYLDRARLKEKEEAHAYLKEKLHLPEYYGNNLDALYDSLTDLGKTEVVLEKSEAGKGYDERIRRVFAAAAHENPDLKLIYIEGKK